MSDERRDLMLLLALGALWGTSYLLIKLAITEIPPASLTALRMCVAAMVLLTWCAARKVPLAGLRAVWPFTISCALLGNILPFTLIAWAELSIDSATAALLLAFAPIGGMVMAHLLETEEPDNLLEARMWLFILMDTVNDPWVIGGQSVAGIARALDSQLSSQQVEEARKRASIWATEAGEKPSE